MISILLLIYWPQNQFLVLPNICVCEWETKKQKNKKQILKDGRSKHGGQKWKVLFRLHIHMHNIS